MSIQKRRSWQRISGELRNNHADLLRRLIFSMGYPRATHCIAEVGSGLGRSTICMAEISPYKIVSVDPHPQKAGTYKPFLENLKRTNTVNRVQVVKEFPERYRHDGRKVILYLSNTGDLAQLEGGFINIKNHIIKNGFACFFGYCLKEYPTVKEYVDHFIIGDGFLYSNYSHGLLVLQKK